MPLIFITGISGSGKSTVLKELKKQGFEAHGVDEEGFADWVDRETGAIVPFPHDNPNINIHEWYKKYRWVLSQVRISKLKEWSDKAAKSIFLVGLAEDEDRVSHLFDKIIYLAVDETTLRQRIENRVDNDFGKTSEEMAVILSWLRDNDDNYRSSGAVVIDATRSIAEVVNDVTGVVLEYEKL